ncbi:MAG TPA: DNA-directed RNA polymerase subunit beta' [Candidatus Fimimonas merdipullorum]|uniref:DNA-directed RNA polymerase subunit beta' n=1 Tax=Candidatus Fimimonas merdipullorum TaxID=2840822 RepID=A0A9D1MWX8_9BACT|nr:DNA-directed RNA polymerase subunit beta' [Candidatus Fimimonas merdipullorum]
MNDFDSIQIGIASPEKIREWSYGEVKKSETINYRTQKPEKDGLFCERIFGPVKDWECHCGKYKKQRFKGVVCEKCGVKVTTSKVRRERMGHIELAAPVSHIWYFRGTPSRIGLILDMSPKYLEQLINFQNYVVLDPMKSGMAYKQILSMSEYRAAKDEAAENPEKQFRAGTGAESVRELLQNINLDEEAEALHAIVSAPGQGAKKVRAIKRLDIVESFRKSGNRPEWMILTVLPVLPPDLRAMVPLDGGRYATSDLNELYRKVINRNNRLKKLIDINAPEILINNEKRMLQDAVDSLLDNDRSKRPQTGPGNRTLKSLSGLLRGKQGRFRQNLLGKRVDYSGRSVIVVGPELKLHQCGIPKEMALELFKPFVMHRLIETKQSTNLKSAKKRVERADDKVWDALEEVIKDHPVMLNRAPTLHRLSIQAFEPVLIEGRAIKLHPLACTAFNADFDGDQMAVHVPLSVEAQTEARFLMLAANNILKLSDGKPVICPTQDMVLGCYYLTTVRGYEEAVKIMDLYEQSRTRALSQDEVELLRKAKFYSSFDEAYEAYVAHDITLHTAINVRQPDGSKVWTTVGRMIFCQAIYYDYADASAEDDSDIIDAELLAQKKVERRTLGIPVALTADMLKNPKKPYLVGKKQLSQIVEKCFRLRGTTPTATMLDNVKALGYKYSTISGLTTSVFDMNIPSEKQEIMHEAEKKVIEIENNFNEGFLTENERYKSVIDVWKDVAGKVEDLVKNVMEEDNPIWMMADSGARGSMNQIRQLCGMRGLMSDPSGRTIELPVKACFREGLSVLEYFISSHGGRKGLADTALKTADSGYLTRRLVDVAQNVIIREEDCSAGGRPQGMWIEAFRGSGKDEIIEKFEDRIIGKYVIDDVVNPATGEIICHGDTMINDDLAKEIVKAGIDRLYMRTVLTCRSEHGVCCKCYGSNMATGKPVNLGEAVGVIAAQSIGEPGTQLTMRTFHTGGVATSDDITQGLPRVEELFEARKPKGCAVICEVNGTAVVPTNLNKKVVQVVDADGKLLKEYAIPYTSRIRVHDGDTVESGTALTEGPINPQDLLSTKGLRAVEEYLVKEVQATYRTNGVEINDKHVEVIVRQMLRKVRIEDAGTTELLPGEIVDIFRFDAANDKALEEDGEPATAKRVLLGITKASLATESFLSAASFQETSRVLTEAAIKNKCDPLYGLKENVIIGKMISAGTGLKSYRDMELVSKEDEFDETATGEEE